MEDAIKGLLVPVDKLRWNCDPDSLGLDSTAEAKDLGEEVIAQERAVSALKFGMTMPGNDYNIFVAGEPRTGLTYLTRAFLAETARKEPTPPDWCYVHNFRDPDHPMALSLQPGLAHELAKDMDELVEDLQAQIPEVFQGEEYRQRREEMIRQFTGQRNATLAELDKRVTMSGFTLNMSQEGMMIAPARNGHIITEEEVSRLTEEEKVELRKKSEALQEEMNQTVIKIRKLEKELKERLKDLDKRVALHAVGYLIDELQEKYAEHRTVIAYLVAVKNDVIKNLGDFKPKEQPPAPFPVAQPEPEFTRYKVNVLVDNSELKGAPVVYEVNPTYTNLFGAMERKASFGALFTDFTMIRPGSIHRANGGYLVLQVRDLLKWYISYEAIKRALKNKEIKIDDPTEMFGLITTKSMKPDPIPLDIKIILIGEPYLYHLLYSQDEQFPKLFKVKAHLDDEVTRQPSEIQNYLAFAAKMVRQRGLRPVDKTGLARLIEYGAELAGKQKKLTLKMALIRDILREADYWAGQEGATLIGRDYVEKAIKQKKFRSSLAEDKLQEFIADGYLNVETSGLKIGQVNGLSVFDLGDHSFGRPSRITASVSVGRQGVIAIDRESKLSGNIHTKGVLIMEGYLRQRYAAERPLSLSASLVFEQSYGLVEGDSASAAELFALLSRLAGAGLKQNLAVTGAISQQGEIQPIGGVNQKIEGFFEVCRARGLTGDQGVIIPQANVADLMLSQEVISAVREGLFKVYSVSRADEALEILSGMPAGERQGDVLFPEGSFNRRVEDRLQELADKALKLAKEGEAEGKSKDEEPAGCAGCGNGG
ncbi:MAG: ATP-binding protein [Thermodesulfobacteriota bacterium]